MTHTHVHTQTHTHTHTHTLSVLYNAHTYILSAGTTYFTSGGEKEWKGVIPPVV